MFSQSDGRIILLKVDSEGAEGRIFTGSQQLLESVDVVLFEIGESWYVLNFRLNSPTPTLSNLWPCSGIAHRRFGIFAMQQCSGLKKGSWPSGWVLIHCLGRRCK